MKVSLLKRLSVTVMFLVTLFLDWVGFCLGGLSDISKLRFSFQVIFCPSFQWDIFPFWIRTFCYSVFVHALLVIFPHCVFEIYSWELCAQLTAWSLLMCFLVITPKAFNVCNVKGRIALDLLTAVNAKSGVRMATAVIRCGGRKNLLVDLMQDFI